MKRRIVFSNTALNQKKLSKISKKIDDNDEIKEIVIYSSRNIKENRTKIYDSQTFKRIKDLIKYIDDNDINTLTSLEINIYYKNKNYAKLNYEEFDNRWELSYNDQDSNIDSLIYNLKPLLKNSPIKVFRQHRMFLLCLISISWLFLTSNEFITKTTFITNIVNFIYLLLFLDIICVKNIPFREYKFITRNKDSIILSIISFVIGLFFQYALDFIISLF